MEAHQMQKAYGNEDLLEKNSLTIEEVEKFIDKVRDKISRLTTENKNLTKESTEMAEQRKILEDLKEHLQNHQCEQERATKYNQEVRSDIQALIQDINLD